MEEAVVDGGAYEASREYKSVIECGLLVDSRRVFKLNSEFFNEEVDVFVATGDDRRQVLYRSADVARHINIRPSRLSMYLSRSDQRGVGIFQATDFLHKALHSRLKLGTYFVNVKVCYNIKDHFANIKKRQVRKYGSDGSTALSDSYPTGGTSASSLDSINEQHRAAAGGGVKFVQSSRSFSSKDTASPRLIARSSQTLSNPSHSSSSSSKQPAVAAAAPTIFNNSSGTLPTTTDVKVTNSVARAAAVSSSSLSSDISGVQSMELRNPITSNSAYPEGAYPAPYHVQHQYGMYPQDPRYYMPPPPQGYDFKYDCVPPQVPQMDASGYPAQTFTAQHFQATSYSASNMTSSTGLIHDNSAYTSGAGLYYPPGSYAMMGYPDHMMVHRDFRQAYYPLPRQSMMIHTAPVPPETTRSYPLASSIAASETAPPSGNSSTSTMVDDIAGDTTISPHSQTTLSIAPEVQSPQASTRLSPS